MVLFKSNGKKVKAEDDAVAKSKDSTARKYEFDENGAMTAHESGCKMMPPNQAF